MGEGEACFSFEESGSGLGLCLVDVSFGYGTVLAGLLREHSNRIQGTTGVLANALLVSHNSVTITGKSRR